MEPTATAKIVAQAAKELGVVPTVYQDVLQPAARELGQKFVVVAKAVSIALAPLEASVWGYEKIKEYLAAKVAARLAGTPAEEIKPPPRVIAGPVVMNMVFAAEEEHLREMYANLLAAAMHGPTPSKAHPSFVRVIEQLSPGEARILQEFGIGNFPPIPAAESFQPAGLLRLIRWQPFCQNCGVSDSLLAAAYRNNLVRLGILSQEGPTLADTYLGLTSYGKLFVDVCVR